MQGISINIPTFSKIFININSALVLSLTKSRTTTGSLETSRIKDQHVFVHKDNKRDFWETKLQFQLIFFSHTSRTLVPKQQTTALRQRVHGLIAFSAPHTLLPITSQLRKFWLTMIPFREWHLWKALLMPYTVAIPYSG